MTTQQQIQRVFNVEYSFDDERWSLHRNGDEPPVEFSESERLYSGEPAVDRMIRIKYGPKARWRWVEKASS